MGVSERALQKKHAGVFTRALSQFLSEEEQRAELKAALEFGRDMTLKEPKHLISCEMVQEFAPVNVTFAEKVHCSECGGSAIGWNERWQWCPLCGAKITRVSRDSNPYDRNTQERVESALQEMLNG